MKYILCLSLLLSCFFGFSQSCLQIVRANSDKAKIYEQFLAASDWRINPNLKLDIHSTGKLTHPIKVIFKTDIDSISFKLAPGRSKNFIVLLNGKDSCLTRIQSPKITDYSKVNVAFHDTVPFTINKFNTNLVPVVLNEMDSLILNFDSGATEICITEQALKSKVRSKPKLYNVQQVIGLGKQIFKSECYDIALVGNEADGLIGWNIFDGMIVELDYDNNKLMLHSKMPKQIANDDRYQKFKLTFLKNKPFIESEIFQSKTRSKSLFFFDLGYQRAVMLDNDVLKASNFPAQNMRVIKKVIMHGTRGNELPVITSNLESLKIGKFVLKNVPAQVMTQNKPMPGLNVHYLGSDVLKRFNTVFDFQKNVIYLKPNHLYDDSFAGQSTGKISN